MDCSAFFIFLAGCCLSVYVLGAVAWRLNDTSRDLPTWVPLVWPFLLVVAYVALAGGRLFRRSV